jgi:hypothetical protein
MVDKIRAVTESSPDISHCSCLNCGEPLRGPYCASCGQLAREVKRSVLYFLKELIRVVFELDGRAYRTVFYLLIRPGFLTNEYFNGRRQRYTPPLRLFLVISIALFLLISVADTLGSLSEAIGSINETPEEPTAPASQDEGGSGTPASIEDFDGLIGLTAQIELPFLTVEANQNLQNYLSAQVEANLTEILADPQEFFMNSLEYITFFMLLMMPVLALIQKLLWVFTGRYYVEHLVLTVHNQSFLFLMMLLNFIITTPDRLGFSAATPVVEWVSDVATLWMAIYLLISLKVYFKQGWSLSVILFLFTSAIYAAVLATGVLIFGMTLVIFG